MTTIIFRTTKTGEYQELECLGHAGFADYGKDIVCASLSVLVINTINSLEELCKTDMDIKTDEKRGLIHCSFHNELNEQEKLLMDSLALGCSAIEDQYGKKYCRIKFEEV